MAKKLNQQIINRIVASVTSYLDETTGPEGIDDMDDEMFYRYIKEIYGQVGAHCATMVREADEYLNKE